MRRQRSRLEGAGDTPMHLSWTPQVALPSCRRCDAALGWAHRRRRYYFRLPAPAAHRAGMKTALFPPPRRPCPCRRAARGPHAVTRRAAGAGPPRRLMPAAVAAAPAGRPRQSAARWRCGRSGCGGAAPTPLRRGELRLQHLGRAVWVVGHLLAPAHNMLRMYTDFQNLEKLLRCLLHRRALAAAPGTGDPGRVHLLAPVLGIISLMSTK